LSGEKIDMSKITEMRGDKRIASNLKATDEQLVDDLNGVLSELQKKMMRTILTHIGQLVEHIRDLG
jgi:transposase